MKLSPPLSGVTIVAKPKFSWGNLLHGTYQSVFARDLGNQMPLYADAVRLRNQVQFSLFGDSFDAAYLVVGHGPSLFETPYADEYCSRDLATWHARSDDWARKILEMQTLEEHRGKTFLYLLTPSKVAQYPDIVPSGYNCPSSAADRAGLVPAWLATLRAEGVHVADTTAVMTAAHGVYPFRMFPMGGAHWNAVGSALSMQALMADLHRLLPNGGFTPFTFAWHMVRRPQPHSLDVDLSELLNLIWRFPTAPVPAVEIHPEPPPSSCPDTKVAVVGGSFGHAVLEYLAKATCNPLAVEYEYWRAYTLRWSDHGIDVGVGVNEAERATTILGADVLIYEENEQVLPHPPQGEALWEFLHNQPVPR